MRKNVSTITPTRSKRPSRSRTIIAASANRDIEGRIAIEPIQNAGGIREAGIDSDLTIAQRAAIGDRAFIASEGFIGPQTGQTDGIGIPTAIPPIKSADSIGRGIPS